MPSGRKQISFTCWLVCKLVIITSAAFANAATVGAALAPAFVSASIAAFTISYTMTACPAFSKFSAIGLPMCPNPINPMVVILTPYDVNSRFKRSFKAIADYLILHTSYLQWYDAQYGLGEYGPKTYTHLRSHILCFPSMIIDWCYKQHAKRDYS